MLMREIKNTSRLWQSGTSIMEGLVAAFVLSVGMLGVFSMQSVSFQVSNNAIHHSEAAFLASDLIEKLRIYTVPPSALGAVLEVASVKDCRKEVCSTEDNSLWEIARWQAKVSRVLPNGFGQITVADGYYKISISFEVLDATQGRNTDTLFSYEVITDV